MKPILYKENENRFKTNGLGILADAISCRVHYGINRLDEVTVKYPDTGIHVESIKRRCIVLVKTDPIRQLQPYRIYRITKPSNHVITIYARHEAYDLQGIPLTMFTAQTAAGALAALSQNAVIPCNFSFTTDMQTTAECKNATPSSIWEVMGGRAGSILDVYGGEWEFDRRNIKLHARRGEDRSVVIAYGKNLTSLEQDENCERVYTGVLPYWTDPENGDVLLLPEKIVNAPGKFDFVRILNVDFSMDLEERPTVERLRSEAKNYITRNKIGVPTVNWKIQFVQLEQTEEFRDMAILERIMLGDTVTVKFPSMGVHAKARAVDAIYDSILERYESITLGSVRADWAQKIVDQGREIEKLPDKTYMQKAVENATHWITNGGGYMVAVKDASGNWKEICSLDTPNIDEAVNVWRWNNAGIGHSANGYNGPFKTAITQDGHIVANFITVGSLTASIIKTGILQSTDGGKTFYLNLDTGELHGNFSSVQINGVSAATSDELSTISNLVKDMQNQLDGVIDTWYGEEIPTINNKPAAEWVTEQDKEKHSGDLYYIVGTGPDSGNAYRWIFLNGRWYWDKLANSDIAKALDAAAKAQDTADGKRRVFVNTPHTPYDQGDLWTQGNSGELMRCNISRQSGAYQPSDWGPATDTGKRFAEFKVTTDGISARVTNLSDSTESRFDQTADEISAKVGKIGGTGSFGWVLNDNSWEIKSNNSTIFRVNKNGAYINGEIQAKTGKIGGWEITSQNWLMGTIPGSDLHTIMAPPGSTGAGGRVFLAGGGPSNKYSYPFEVYQDGRLRAKDAYIEGEIQASGGKLGRWVLDSSSINYRNEGENKNLVMSVFGGLYGGISGKEWHIRMNGDAYFESCTVKGHIEAGTGKIGGWNIDGQILGNAFVSEVADGNRVGLSPGIDPKTEEYQPKDGLCLWAGASWNGSDKRVAYEKAPFRVYADGSLYASKGTFSGRIEAESGYFHGTVRAGKIEYGSANGYVPEAGLASGTRTKLGYAENANAILTGTTEATNIKAKILTGTSVSATTNFTFNGQRVRTRAIRVKEWKPAIQQWVTCDLTVLEAIQ